MIPELQARLQWLRELVEVVLRYFVDQLPADRFARWQREGHADRIQVQRRRQGPVWRRADRLPDPSPRSRDQGDVEQHGQVRLLLRLRVGEAHIERPQVGWPDEAGA